MKSLALLFGTFLLAGCTAAPQGIMPVDNFELDRYLGTWFEIARLDHRFERGLSQVSATYSKRSDGGVDVINRGFNSQTGVWKEAKGRAYFIGEPSVARLKVTKGFQPNVNRCIEAAICSKGSYMIGIVTTLTSISTKMTVS